MQLSNNNSSNSLSNMIETLAVKSTIMFNLFRFKMAASTRDQIMTERIPAKETSSAKVTVVGVGQVGMAAAFSILSQVGIRNPLFQRWKDKTDIVWDRGRRGEITIVHQFLLNVLTTVNHTLIC